MVGSGELLFWGGFCKFIIAKIPTAKNIIRIKIMPIIAIFFERKRGVGWAGVGKLSVFGCLVEEFLEKPVELIVVIDPRLSIPCN